MRTWMAGVVLLATLAGCADDGPAASARDPCAEPCVFTSSELPGVELTLAHRAAGREHEVEATVHNKGAMIYWHLWVPECDLHPWRDRMEGPSGPVDPREPEVHCLPCGQDPLAAGEVMRRTFTWSERLWHWESEALRDAPPGTYHWTVFFSAALRQEDVCTEERDLQGTLSLDIT